MEIDTKYHGIKNYSKDDIIYFNKGIPGFENLKKFILFKVEDNDIFSVLHSIEDKNIGFVVISPFAFMKDYEFDLSDEKVQGLNIKEPHDVLILCTVTINSNIKEVTSNFKAPIVINLKDKVGEQIILQDEDYDIKYPLFKE